MNGWVRWSTDDLLAKMGAIYATMMDGDHHPQYVRGFTRALMFLAMNIGVKPKEVYDYYQVPMRSGFPYRTDREVETETEEEQGPRRLEDPGTYEL